jgi:hypothetical protein
MGYKNGGTTDNHEQVGNVEDKARDGPSHEEITDMSQG